MEGIELKVGKLSSQSAAIHETHNTFPFLRKVHYFTLPSFIVMLQRKVIWYIYSSLLEMQNQSILQFF